MIKNAVPNLFVSLIGLGLILFAVSARANPFWQAQGWKTDFSKKTIEFSEILSGGPPKDGIPPIDNPKYMAVSEIKNLDPKEPVIRLEIGKDARAYPLRVMIWHEIVNDTVGGTPVTVTYCPLCNSAIVFDRRLEGKLYDFGTSGKLRNSDLIMYDRQTESWWQQFTGEAIVGKLAGKELGRIPARLDSFEAYAKEFPNGKVLVPNQPRSRAYGENPYVGYDQARFPFLFKGEFPEGIEAMARVIVVRAEGKTPFAVSMEKVRKAGGFQKDGLTVSWRKGLRSAVNQSKIATSKDVGAVQVEDAQGNEIPHEVTFAFVFHAFHKDKKIIQ